MCEVGGQRETRRASLKGLPFGEACQKAGGKKQQRKGKPERWVCLGVPDLGRTWPPRLAKHQLEGRKCS